MSNEAGCAVLLYDMTCPEHVWEFTNIPENRRKLLISNDAAQELRAWAASLLEKR